MIKFIKIASKFLLRHKQYTIINITGLCLSLVAVFAIALYIYDELSFDRAHERSSDIYRLVDHRTDENGEEVDLASVAFKTSQTVGEIPNVEKATALTFLGRTKVSNDENDNTFYERYTFAEQSFFDFFDYPVLYGDKSHALASPFQVVVTRSTAIKYFGTESTIGKIIHVDREDTPYIISAVIEDFPSNSHLNFDMLYSFSSNDSRKWYQDSRASDWSSNFFTVYYLLKPGADPSTVASTLSQLVNSHRQQDEVRSKYWLQQLKDIHFYSAGIRGGFEESQGDISYVYIFGSVGIFILAIALVNYINLATALSLTRGKEIGIKKVTGATRFSLATQFVVESTLLTFIATIAALAILNALLPSFNAFTGKTISQDLLFAPATMASILLFDFCTGFLAGSYPAFRLSRLKPVQAMKGFGKSSQSLLTRRALVVFQFFLSIALIIATLTAYRQIEFIRTRNLGFNVEQLVVADINSGSVRRGATTIKNEFLRMPGVSNVSVSSRVPGEWKNLPQVLVTMTSNPTGVDCYFMGADEDFLTTFQMQLMSGMNFRPDFPGDSSSILLNETAARLLGITEPGDEVIIPSVNMAVNDELLDEPFHARVIGIVKDFNFQSLHYEIAPLVIGYRNNPIQSIDYFTIRIAVKDMRQSLATMQSIMYDMDPSHLLEYNFLDERLADFYKQDVQRGRLFAAAAAVAIVLACLGLFSLVSFNTEQRTKEIGVRKVLGATVPQITLMLCSEYVKLVALGLIAAIPASVWVLNGWLSTFAYRTHVNWLILVSACLVSLVVALITVGLKSFRAAVNNPVDSLRAE